MKAQDEEITRWLDVVQDVKAKDEVIAEDMDLGRMHPMMMIDVRPRMGKMLRLVVAELIDGTRVNG